MGREITVTRFLDHSVEVEDHGRGIPVDYNNKEERYNWELVFCEMYAGGKYNNDTGESYEYSLGLNGLGLCATQYASEYMDVDIRRTGSGTPSTSSAGRTWAGLHKEAYGKKGHRLQDPVEAGPAGVHRHRRIPGVLPGHLKAPGGGQRRDHLPLEKRGGAGKV